MAYVQIPKDLSTVKTKVMFGLTKRQLICFSIAAVIGVPLFFLLRGSLGSTGSTFVLVGVTIPAFLFAMYQKNGQPLEKHIAIMAQAMFLRPKKRPYQTRNYYKKLEKQIQFDEEVKVIVQSAKKRSGGKKPQSSPRKAIQKGAKAAR